MHKGFIITASVLGAVAVGLGAFGAHGLKSLASPAQLTTYETAVKYQFYHVFALLLTALLYAHFPVNGVIVSGKMFIAGMAIFSGSLYLLTFLQIAGYNQFYWLGAITPIGGLLLVLAWVWLAISVYRYNG
ncbi:DUF423 domain-containing protein [Sediminibacterium sp. TEGAF015]|uniref:DUF423 domain-containing protein n=1 Tax=Sediminibacterium sp. TEGAF015 TaxID=575378 RepID=UPI0022074087|nr:DUF423 domain-containing protein [Sediminibacterium sp. TEGAF015]BDQ11464.1 membrane protein [Sediminibacterium sp. TEGAF015]